jgi:hypothetical protein
MKRVSQPRPERRVLQRTLRVLSSPPRTAQRIDGRVANAVLWAVGRLAQRLGPAA